MLTGAIYHCGIVPSDTVRLLVFGSNPDRFTWVRMGKNSLIKNDLGFIPKSADQLSLALNELISI